MRMTDDTVQMTARESAAEPFRIALENYASTSQDREQTRLADAFLDLLATRSDAFERDCVHGHFTGSAWVMSADGARVLLTHHRKLGLWLQPGGHADGDSDLCTVALREAQEETGLRGLRITTEIFDIDRHRIPARADEPEHWHYDVRYVVRAGADESFVVSDESHALAWRDLSDVAEDEKADVSVRRMAMKSLAITTASG